MSNSFDRLFLKYDILPSVPKITTQSKLVFMGSCFSESIGGILKESWFDTTINPYGIVFNPYSLLTQLRLIFENKFDPLLNIVSNANIFYHLDFHSEIHGESMDELKQRIKERTHMARKQLASCNWIFLTLGTCWVYEYIDTGTIVANCHKQPSNHFHKRLLEHQEVEECLNRIVALIRTHRPQAHIVFTISPVRHTRDGLWENNVSKGRLQSSLYDMVKKDDSLNYFPAYEFVNDVLRDYRFFNSDLIHPTDDAVDFVMQEFISHYLRADSQQYLAEVMKYQQFKNHVPKSSLKEAISNHVSLVADRGKELCTKYPHLNGKIEK